MVSHWMVLPSSSAHSGPWNWFSVVPSNHSTLSPSFTDAVEALTLDRASLMVNIQPSGALTAWPLMVWMNRPKVAVVE